MIESSDYNTCIGNGYYDYRESGGFGYGCAKCDRERVDEECGWEIWCWDRAIVWVSGLGFVSLVENSGSRVRIDSDNSNGYSLDKGVLLPESRDLVGLLLA